MPSEGSNPPEDVSDATIAAAIPGFGLSTLVEHAQRLEKDPDPQGTLSETREALLRFLAARDPVAFLARTGLHVIEQSSRNSTDLIFEQSEAEILQSLALTLPRGPRVPTAPNGMVRAWSLAQRNLRAFSGVISQDWTPDDPASGVAAQARVQTLYYRNFFSSEDAKAIVPALLKPMDNLSLERLGYRISDFASALLGLLDKIGPRIGAFRAPGEFWHGRVDDVELSAITSIAPMLKRAWRFSDENSSASKAQCAFQLSEMAWAPVFTFTQEELRKEWGDAIAQALTSISIRFGELAGANLEKLYLDSPIRERPFIRIDDDALFLPIPGLLVSFPFQIVERLIRGDAALETAYSTARSRYLEGAVEEILRTALPSARVYHPVRWQDPDTGEAFENDLVAMLGNHIFLVEAKSGKIKPASRRGGLDSLRKNFKQLYVEPGIQARRLEALLHRGSDAQMLLRDGKGRPLEIDLSRPVIVHSFGVCIEHFASITSNREKFETLGLIGPGDPWAPILSLGELRMIDARLDTEVSFFHYLTRRSVIEEQLRFHGDEQDLLSMYLVNGFQLDSTELDGRQVMFGMADALVRGPKIARKDRTEFETLGIQLPPGWRRICAELYAEDARHRFDMIETILNQHPGSLAGLEKRARAWRSGARGGSDDLTVVRSEVGNRMFVLAQLLSRNQFESEQAWHAHAREIAAGLQGQFNATECVVVLRARKSRAAFDAISFFRVARQPKLA